MNTTKTQKQHEESGCTDYLQHNADNCPQMQHTPGPWSTKDGQIYAENDTQGRTFALIPYYDHEPQQDANARLIAAAPDLLAACKIALDRLEAFNPEIKTPVTQKTLRVAISKAEGNDQ